MTNLPIFLFFLLLSLSSAQSSPELSPPSPSKSHPHLRRRHVTSDPPSPQPFLTATSADEPLRSTTETAPSTSPPYQSPPHRHIISHPPSPPPATSVHAQYTSPPSPSPTQQLRRRHVITHPPSPQPLSSATAPSTSAEQPATSPVAPPSTSHGFDFWAEMAGSPPFADVNRRDTLVIPLPSPGIEVDTGGSELEVPLLTEPDDRDRAPMRLYSYWRITAFLLHCVSAFFAMLHVRLSLMRRPERITEVWLYLYALYAIGIVFLYRFIFPILGMARAGSLVLLAIVEVVVTRIFILLMSVTSPYFHISNCIRAMSFLCLLKTAFGVNIEGVMTFLVSQYTNSSFDYDGLGSYVIFYVVVLLFSIFVAFSPGTRRPTASDRRHRFLSLFLGDYNNDGENGDSTNEDSSV